MTILKSKSKHDLCYEPHVHKNITYDYSQPHGTMWVSLPSLVSNIIKSDVLFYKYNIIVWYICIFKYSDELSTHINPNSKYFDHKCT